MCLTPMTLRHKFTGEWNTFPCGRCPKCVGRRVSGWSFRLMQQLKVSDNGMFVTLTYNWKHLEPTKNGFKSLNKVTLQLFFKRLRKHFPSGTIKYYAVGEYGSERGRPHYHVILFNATEEAVIKSWCDNDGVPIGDVHFGTVTEASIGYCLKYISKERKIGKFARDDRQREFALMSKGLGKNYITRAMVRWHKEDLLNRMYCTLVGGKKISMPRYYKDKIYCRTQSFVTGSGNLIMTVVGERERVAAFAVKRNEVLKSEDEAEWYKLYGDDWPHYRAESVKFQFQCMHKRSNHGKRKADMLDQL